MKFQRSILYLLITAVVVITAFVLYAYKNHLDNQEASFWVNHTNEVIRHVERVYSTTSQIESGSRGYVISGRKAFADLCDTAAGEVNKELGSLRELTLDNPFQQRNIDTLALLVNQKVAFSCRVVTLRDSSAGLAMSLVSSGSGKELMEHIKDRADTMLMEESRLLEQRIGAKKTTEKRSFDIVLSGSICTLLFLILFLYRLNRDIQLRKKAESEVKISETKYRRLIEEAGVVMFTTDITGNFNFISDRVKNLTGFLKEELLGQSYSVLVAPEWLEKVGAFYQAQFKERRSESLLEFPIITKEKIFKWVEQIGVILYDEAGKIMGMQFIVKDIDEKKRVEAELERSEQERKKNQERLQSILDNSTSLIYVKDTDGRYRVVNKKFESVFHITGRELIGKTDYELHEKEAADRYSTVDRWVIENKRAKEVEEVLTHPDGDHHYMVVKFPLFGDKDEVQGLCGIATDISDRILYEQELVEARKIAENAEKLQEQFLANMSHDIRTPLNGIIGMTGLLSGTGLNGEQSEFISGIKQSADTLLVLINDILDLSKIKAGKLDIESINFRLPELINGSLYTLKQKAGEKGLPFGIHIDPAIPEVLKGDPNRLSQILVNLAGNAVKFTDEGMVQVTAEAIAITAENILIRFSVRDTGIGIPADRLDAVFESFSQSRKDTARKYGGTGLGLAIVRQLITLQGGEITVESKLNAGSHFYFTLPYIIPPEDDRQVATKLEGGSYIPAGVLDGYQLLVAEDDPVNQKVIRYTLKKAGVQADIVRNGRELIESLQSGKKYDLVLSDIHMPEMDGYESTRFIRQSLKLSIPVLAMTATVINEEKDLYLEAGMDDYISKPFSAMELLEKIRQYIRPKEMGSPSPPAGEAAGSAHTPAYDLGYLREMDDQEYMKEVLDIFLSSTPAMLKEIKTGISQQKWPEVYRVAHRLKSTVGMLKMEELLETIMTIETNARELKQLDGMPDLINKCIALYQGIHPLLEEEKNKI